MLQTTVPERRPRPAVCPRLQRTDAAAADADADADTDADAEANAAAADVAADSATDSAIDSATDMIIVTRYCCDTFNLVKV